MGLVLLTGLRRRFMFFLFLQNIGQGYQRYLQGFRLIPLTIPEEFM